MAKWFYLVDGQQVGPIESAALKQLADSGRLKPDAKVRRADMAAWHLAKHVKGLFTAIQSTVPLQLPKSLEPSVESSNSSGPNSTTKSNRTFKWGIVSLGIAGCVLFVLMGASMLTKQRNSTVPIITEVVAEKSASLAKAATIATVQVRKEELVSENARQRDSDAKPIPVVAQEKAGPNPPLTEPVALSHESRQESPDHRDVANASATAKAEGHTGGGAVWSYPQYRIFRVSETIPGSLTNFHPPADQFEKIGYGGLSENGSSMFGNTVVGSNGNAAYCWLEGQTNRAGVILGRKLQGQNWERQRLDAAADDVFGQVGKMLITLPFTGVGPKVTFDSQGNVILVLLDRQLQLQTFVWPADAKKPSSRTRLKTTMQFEMCHVLHLRKAVDDYELYQFEDQLYLTTSPAEWSDNFCIYRFENDSWKPLFELNAKSGSLSFDASSKDLYLVAIVPMSHGETRLGLYPKVLKHTSTVGGSWQELINPRIDSPKEQYGVTSYLGASSLRPAIVASNGVPTVFWYQEGIGTQGAEYRDGSWRTCADWQYYERNYKSGPDLVIREYNSSFTLQGRLPNLGDGKMTAFRTTAGAIVLFGGRGYDATMLEKGKAYPIRYAWEPGLNRDTDNVIVPYPLRGLPGGWHVGPWTMDGNGAMEPQGLTITQNGSRFITQATLRSGSGGGDVFVFSLEDNQRYAERKQIIDGLQP